MEFPPNGIIKEYSYRHDDIDIFIEIRELYDQWKLCENYKDINFNSLDIIQKAIFMSVDNILPRAAQKALALKMLEGIFEIQKKKYTVDSLHIKPEKAGRKKNPYQRGYMLRSIHKKVSEGSTKTAAYNDIAKEMNLSTDTVRREYERAIKRQSELQKKKKT